MDRAGKGMAAKAIVAQRGFAVPADDAARGSLGAALLVCIGCVAGVVLLVVGIG